MKCKMATSVLFRGCQFLCRRENCASVLSSLYWATTKPAEAHTQDFQKGGYMGVRRVCMHKHVRLGGMGACSPKEFLNALRLLLRPFWDRSRVYSWTASDRNKDNLVCIMHYVINVACNIFLRYVHTHFFSAAVQYFCMGLFWENVQGLRNGPDFCIWYRNDTKTENTWPFPDGLVKHYV